MALGPDSPRGSGMSNEELLADLEDQIDQELAKTTDPEPNVRFTSPKPMPDAVAEELRGRYLEAGWQRVAFKEIGRSLGGVQYEVAFER
ncbi:hypothetical protein BH20GEM3_BH20GEM3_07510 [soil metagenome]